MICKHCKKPIFWYNGTVGNDRSRWLHGKDLNNWEWTRCGFSGELETVAEPLNKEEIVSKILKKVDEM